MNKSTTKKNTLLTVSVITLVIIITLALFALIGGINPNSTTTTTIPGTNTTMPLGNKTVTILEYSDFQCPYCARAEATMKEIKKTYGDRVEIIFKHFPLPFHSNAEKAAEASECARDQGKFQEYHDMLFENQNSLDVNSLKKYATELGLDSEKFSACLDSGEKVEVVKSNQEEGASKGVTGTPTFFINGNKVVGAQQFEKFKSIIDSELGV